MTSLDREAGSMEDAAGKPGPRHSLRRLVGDSRPYATALAIALGCGAALAGARFVRAYLVGPLLDDVLVPGTRLGGAEAFELLQPRLLEIGIIAALTMIVTPLAFFGRNYLIGMVVARVRRDLDRRVARTFLSTSLREHQERSTGDRLTRALSDVRLTSNALSLFYRDIVTNVLMVTTGIVMLFVTSWQLATLAVATAPLFLMLVSFFGGRIQSGAHRRQATQSELSQRLVSILSGIRVIKAFGGEALEEAAIAQQTDRFYERHMRILWNRVMAKSTAEALGQGVAFVVIAIGSVLALKQAWGMSLGALSAFAAILFATQKPIKALTAGHSEIMEHVAGADRLFELLDEGVPEPERGAERPMPSLRDHLRFDRVSFAHGEERVLDEIDFEVARGEVVAIVGRTGAGKSTLVDLLLRFYEPTSGTIEIDGVDAQEFDRASYLNQIALVGQDPFLFDLSIAENIGYGTENTDLAAIRAAASAVGAHEFIAALPEGYATVVGEFGARLSGGQRQRIALARALLRDASILVLDEATSALDPKTEQGVQQAIAARRGRQTIFVVTHRPEMVRHADRCLLLDEGQLVATGSHETLLRASASYRDLMGRSDPEPGPHQVGEGARHQVA